MSIRSILAVALAILAVASSAAAADDQEFTLDLKQVCTPGCIIDLEPTRFENGDFVGEFHSIGSATNLLVDVTGFNRTEFPMTLYRLSKEPGEPIFMSLDYVKEYIEAQNVLVREARVKGEQAS